MIRGSVVVIGGFVGVCSCLAFWQQEPSADGPQPAVVVRPSASPELASFASSRITPAVETRAQAPSLEQDSGASEQRFGSRSTAALQPPAVPPGVVPPGEENATLRTGSVAASAAASVPAGATVLAVQQEQAEASQKAQRSIVKAKRKKAKRRAVASSRYRRAPYVVRMPMRAFFARRF